MSFRPSSTYARSSVLEFGGILRSSQRGYVKSGEESNDLRLEMQDASSWQNREERTPPTVQEVVVGVQRGEENEPHTQASPNNPGQTETNALESSALDVFNPFSDPEMLSLFPGVEMLGLDSFDTDFMDLDYLNIDNY